ncbi:MAG: M28 family peptidase [Chloroflexi bacterium]|nr:M28 family peptidase [Chloroflexota bacterium]
MSRRAIGIYLIGLLLLTMLVGGYYLAAFDYGNLEQSPFATTQRYPTGTWSREKLGTQNLHRSEKDPATPDVLLFHGDRAFEDILTQVGFGPRIPGSIGHDKTRAWIQKELEDAGWIVLVHSTERLGHPIYNLVAQRSELPPKIILGAHYDTRQFADRDPDPLKASEPVPGANDGASGVAVLLELARVMPIDTTPTWLVFFDAEDNGRIPEWDWILGSQAFVEEISVSPQAVVIVDMVGDSDLNIYFEGYSDARIRSEIWTVADELGYSEYFIQEERHTIVDDHLPFIQAGIPAVDIIDFDYEFWHTTEDTSDKVSPESLQIVGDTLMHWILERSR